MNIGTKIKEARQTLGITQEQAAEQLMVSRQTISSWENGKSLPDIVSVIKMSELYHLNLDELLKGDKVFFKGTPVIDFLSGAAPGILLGVSFLLSILSLNKLETKE